MDGFVVQAAKGKRGCGLNLNNPACSQSTAPDVMGYHTAAEIPNYWTYARRIQAMDATSSLNRSAGVSHSRVLRGRSLSRAAISSRSA